MNSTFAESLMEQCIERNPAIARWMGTGEDTALTLDEFTDIQLAKHRLNATGRPLQDRTDLVEICRSYVFERLGDRNMAKMAAETIETGMLLTADHLGGLYSPQSFQGDLLFAQMLRKEKPDVGCVPILAFGTVPLGSSTYGRGIQVFSDTCGIKYLPVYSAKYTQSAASLVPPLDERVALRALKTSEQADLDENTGRTLRRLLEKIYLAPAHLNSSSFGDQAFYVGCHLYRGICGRLELPPILPLESEAVMIPLIIADLKNENSLLRILLDDRRLIQHMNDTRTEEGEPLSRLLFRMADHRGRIFPLNVEPDGSLIGQSMGGETMQLSGSRQELEEFFLSRKLLPGTYLDVLVSAFARGSVWYGGIFQSSYLPVWQERTKRVFIEEGYRDLAKQIGAVTLSGYISGPIFALADTGDGAVNAGPVEFLTHRPDGRQLEAWMQTDIRSAHQMGMFEFYHDLMYASERKEGWYEVLAKYSKQKFSENILH